MWTDKIINYETQLLSNLNLRFDLQFALFTIEVLTDIIQFKVNKNKELSINKSKKEIDTEQFFYWWQITRYENINKKESELIENYEKINKSIQSLNTTTIDQSLSEDEKQAKIIETKMKIDKLIEYRNKEEPKLKINLQRLNSFKNSCYTKETFNNLLDSILIILKNKEDTKDKKKK
tara:strand:+ start:10532 stop:11062 length:531 start_codon:yes stop_codon:yes gene_type:complete